MNQASMDGRGASVSRGEARRPALPPARRSPRAGLLGAGLLAVLGGAASCADQPESKPAVEVTAGEAASALGSTPVLCVKLSAADANISAEKKTSNYGSSSFAISGASTAGVPAQFAALFQFDTKAIPTDATVVSAAVSLSQSSTGAAKPGVHLVTAPWNEGLVTWGSFAGAYVAKPFVSFAVSGTTTVSFNVAPQAQGWITKPASNFGIYVEQDTSKFQAKYKSNDYPVGSLRPVLDLCYKVLCGPTFADCNGSAADGCEADLSSPSSCGACGVVCPALPHAAAGCAAGACSIGACDPGFGDCDGDPANGCEASLDVVPGSANCGACGVSCPPSGEICPQYCNGIASLTCPQGLFCSEVPLSPGEDAVSLCVPPSPCVGIGSFSCPYWTQACSDDPTDSCDGSVDASCPGICLPWLLGPQDPPIPDFCGGPGGVQCGAGFLCQDIPCDGCDPANGGVSCMGTCAVDPNYVPGEQCPYAAGGIIGAACPPGLFDSGNYGPGEDSQSLCIPPTPCAVIGVIGGSCNWTLQCQDDPTDGCDAAINPSCPGLCLPWLEASPTLCGGLMGVTCGAGLVCADVPCDGCLPSAGGVDCLGTCIAP
jgi:hypothetical protein